MPENFQVRIYSWIAKASPQLTQCLIPLVSLPILLAWTRRGTLASDQSRPDSPAPGGSQGEGTLADKNHRARTPGPGGLWPWAFEVRNGDIGAALEEAIAGVSRGMQPPSPDETKEIIDEEESEGMMYDIALTYAGKILAVVQRSSSGADRDQIHRQRLHVLKPPRSGRGAAPCAVIPHRGRDNPSVGRAPRGPVGRRGTSGPKTIGGGLGDIVETGCGSPSRIVVSEPEGPGKSRLWPTVALMAPGAAAS